jgi:hypothetical protein
MVQKPQIDRERGGIPVPLGERDREGGGRGKGESANRRRHLLFGKENQKGRERERKREVIFPFRAAVSLNVSASPRGVSDIPARARVRSVRPGRDSRLVNGAKRV